MPPAMRIAAQGGTFHGVRIPSRGVGPGGRQPFWLRLRPWAEAGLGPVVLLPLLDVRGGCGDDGAPPKMTDMAALRPGPRNRTQLS
jgi:hypothetical protein